MASRDAAVAQGGGQSGRGQQRALDAAHDVSLRHRHDDRPAADVALGRSKEAGSARDRIGDVEQPVGCELGVELTEDCREGSVIDRSGPKVFGCIGRGDDSGATASLRFLAAADQKDLHVPAGGDLLLLDREEIGGDLVEPAIDPGHTTKLTLDHDRIGLLHHQLAFVVVGLGDHRLVGR